MTDKTDLQKLCKNMERISQAYRKEKYNLSKSTTVSAFNGKYAYNLTQKIIDAENEKLKKENAELKRKNEKLQQDIDILNDWANSDNELIDNLLEDINRLSEAISNLK